MYSGGPYFQSKYAHMRQQEMIAEAEKYRLLRQATQNHENACIQQFKLHQKALLKLGEQLVNWGTYLQGRYLRERDTPSVEAYQQHGAFGK